MEQDTATFTFRLPHDLKRVFDETSKSNDLTSAQVIRSMMREYIKKNAQGSFLK